MPGVRANAWLGMGTQLQRTVRRGALAACAPRRALGQRRPRAYREVGVRIKGLTRIFSGSRASVTRGQVSLPPRRRTPRPQPPPLSAFFGEVVGDVGASPLQTVTSPPRTATSLPANWGNCTIRAATRRRHAEERLLMVQNPHVSPKCTAGMEGVGGTGSRGQASRHGPDRGARWAAVA